MRLRENKLGFQIHNKKQQYNENVIFNASNQNLNISRVAAIQYGCQDFIAFLQTKELILQLPYKVQILCNFKFLGFFLHRKDISNSYFKHY